MIIFLFNSKKIYFTKKNHFCIKNECLIEINVNIKIISSEKEEKNWIERTYLFRILKIQFKRPKFQPGGQLRDGGQS